MPGSATLLFKINTFVDLSTGNLMTAVGTNPVPPTGSNTVEVSQASEDAQISVSSDGSVTVVGGLNELNVSIAGPTNPAVLFFQQKSGPTSPPSAVFGPYKVVGSGANTMLQVKDDGASGTTFEFYVLARTPNDHYGLIDPKIINT